MVIFMYRKKIQDYNLREREVKLYFFVVGVSLKDTKGGNYELYSFRGN